MALNLYRNHMAREFFNSNRWLATDAEVALKRNVAFRRYWFELDSYLLRNREPFASFADASSYFLDKWAPEDAAEDITVDRNTPVGKAVA